MEKMEFKTTHRVSFYFTKPSGFEGVQSHEVMLIDSNGYTRVDLMTQAEPTWTVVCGMWLHLGCFTPIDLPGVVVVEAISDVGA